MNSDDDSNWMKTESIGPPTWATVTFVVLAAVTAVAWIVVFTVWLWP